MKAGMHMNKSSAISGFYKLNLQERLEKLREFANLTDEECNQLQNTGALPFEVADMMIENLVGAMPVPLGIGVNFLINNKDYLIPMATEEPSVIAAASFAGSIISHNGAKKNRTSRCKIA